MTSNIWHNIEYKEVNLLREHYANQKGARTYSMLSPSDVPTHFLLEQSEDTIEISFRYMNESEKKTKISVLDRALLAEVGKNSKKIYYIKININKLAELMEAATDKKNLIRNAAECKVKKTSYSAIREIFSKYIEKSLILENGRFAF